MDYIERSHRALLEFMAHPKVDFDTFAIPILSNYDYDVIGITSSSCFKIKIICTETKQPSGAYIANLLRSGGYEQGKEKKKHFNNKTCDFVFVRCPDEKYLIPSCEIVQTRAITLSVFQQFKI
jgi:hypothetical protein